LSASIVAGLEITAHKAMQIYEKNVDKFIAPSEFLMRKFREHGFSQPMVHLPNFVDLEQFQPSYVSEGYAVHYGRLVREKGVMTLLEAMRMVPDLHLYVAGTGDAEAEMKQYIQQHNLENVTMLGYLASEELIPLVQKAAFSIVPSEWYENYSMSVIESLACGTPVIGSRIGGIPEQIIDGTNGLLFEMGRSDSLAEKIRYMIQNPEELARMSRSTRQLVETVNDPENHYQETMQIYESVMR
jgi:glycosyltransferase involved in cell wall biosynthesis